MERLKWIDLLRGFCMMAILWFHTEMYYVGYDKTPYAFYVGDVLAVFFFISGYLMYQHEPFDIKKKLKSIIRYLILPYFIFTSVIAFTKYLFLHHDNIYNIIYEILIGHASWFIAALIISQLLFILLLLITKRNIIYLALISCCSLVLSYFIGNSYRPSPLFFEQNIWHFNEALLGCFLLFLGYVYHQYESIINIINTITYTLFLFIIVCIIKYIIYIYNLQLTLGPIIVSNYPLFIIDLLFSILLLIHIFKRLPSLKMIEWTGSHSIAYYFICGGIPFMISYLFCKIGFTYLNFISLVCAFIVVYIISTIITWLIYKYTPIFKKIKNAGD